MSVHGGLDSIRHAFAEELRVSGGLTCEPLIAAFATVPVMIMVIYLLLARRAGAFENL